MGDDAVNTELRWIKETLVKIDAKFDAYQANYVPRTELNVMFGSVGEQIAGVQSDLKKLEDEHIAGLKQDIEGMKNIQQNKRMNAPQWGLVALNAAAIIVSLIVLAKGMVS